MMKSAQPLGTGFAASAAAWLAMACLAGCGGGNRQAAEQSRTGVMVQTVEAGPIFETLTLPGTVEAIEDTQLSAEASGQLMSQPVTEGDRVIAGQLIAELDASEATAAWEQADKGVAAARRAADAAEANAQVARSGVDTAKAAVTEAQAAGTRAAQRKASVEKLFQSGDATEDEHDQVVSDAAIAAARLKSAEAALVSADARVASAQAAVKQAEAAVAVAEAGERLAKITLEKHTIRSPVAGTVEDLPYDLREYVRAGTPVCRIVRTDRLKVIVNCPERDAQFVNAMKQRHEDAVKEDPKAAGRPDEPAAGEKELFRDGQPLIRFKDEQVGFQRYGVIDWVALVADPMTRTYETRILLNNPPNDPAKPPIRPGMIATVQIVRRVNRAAVCVPMTAVVTRGQRQVIYLFAPGEDEPNVGTATELAADFGLADPTRIQVVGLPAGSKVIVGWDIEIRTGDAVRVKQWLPGAPAGEDGKAPRISQIHTD